MVTIEYKILFEVRFLHDYYLADRSGNSFFSLELNAQDALLEEKLKKERYDIHADFELLMSQRDQSFFRNQKMKLIKTKLGFFVGIEVEVEKSGGGKLIYRPMIPLRPDAELKIGLGLKNQFFINISNLPLTSKQDELLYFTNTGEKIDNFLARPIAKLEKGQEYNMGDLCKRGNFIYQALEKNSGETQPWQRIQGNGYVHQADLSPIRQEPWFRDWLMDLGTTRSSPFGILSINLQSENQGLSPIKKNGYLTTEFLPSQKRPLHPIYELRFLGRSTYWRYKQAGGFNETEKKILNKHTKNLFEFENGDYVSKSPIFLAAEMPYYLGLNGFRLPYAKPYPIKFENEKVYSDIYFNAINPIQDVV